MMMLSVDDNNFVGDDGDRVYSFRVVSSVVMETEIGKLVSQKMFLFRPKAHYDRLCLPRGQLTACSKTLTLQILCVTCTKDVHHSYTRNKDLCDQQVLTFYRACAALNN